MHYIDIHTAGYDNMTQTTDTDPVTEAVAEARTAEDLLRVIAVQNTAAVRTLTEISQLSAALTVQTSRLTDTVGELTRTVQMMQLAVNEMAADLNRMRRRWK